MSHEKPRKGRLLFAAIALLAIGCAGDDSGKEESPPDVVIVPEGVTVKPGGEVRFGALIPGLLDQSVRWDVRPPHVGGTIDPDGLYRAPNGQGAFQVAATSVTDPHLNHVVDVFVLEDDCCILLSVYPQLTVVAPRGQTTLIARTNFVGEIPTWSLDEPASGGVVTEIGDYTAPRKPGDYHVRATSVEEPDKSAIIHVQVENAPMLEMDITPASSTVASGETLKLWANVTGTSDWQVEWLVIEAKAGQVVSSGFQSGLFTADEPGTYSVYARSLADPTRVAQTRVTVVP